MHIIHRMELSLGSRSCRSYADHAAYNGLRPYLEAIDKLWCDTL